MSFPNLYQRRIPLISKDLSTTTGQDLPLMERPSFFTHHSLKYNSRKTHPPNLMQTGEVVQKLFIAAVHTALQSSQSIQIPAYKAGT